MFAVTWAFGASGNNAGGAGVRVISSTGESVTIEYRPDVRTAGTVTIDGVAYTRFRIDGNNAGGNRRPGSPDLPEREVTIRLRGTEGNSAEIVESSYEDLPARIAPVPHVKMQSMAETRSAAGGDVRYAIDPAAYSRIPDADRSPIGLRSIGAGSTGALGMLVLHPVIVDPIRGTVRMYTRLVVKISFGPAGGTGSVPPAISDLGAAINDPAGAPQNLLKPTSRAATVANSVLASGEWYRFPVTDDGIYKLTGSQLLALGVPSSTDPGTVKVYGYNGRDLPTDPTVATPDDLPEVAVYTSDGGTPGRLDDADYILFYAKGVKGWNYDPVKKLYSHYQGHFSTTNFYWITSGGSASKQMTLSPTASVIVPYRPGSVAGRMFREDEKINLLNSGMEWLGQSLAPSENVTYTVGMPGVDTSYNVNYVIHVGARSPDASTMNITEHTLRVATAQFYGVNVGEYDYQLSDRTLSFSLRPTFGNVSQLRFQYLSSNPAGTGYIDWYEVSWRRELAAVNDALQFFAPDTNAVVEYTVEGFSGTASIFDVSSYDNPVMITGAPTVSGTVTFQTRLAAGSSKELALIGPSGFKSVSGITRIANQNLHGDTAAAANIIIVHPDFMGAALRLKAHRESPLGGGIQTTVVDINQIYNEFGGGIGSPAAVRNYLKYRYQNASRSPQFVLLFGDGDFDYKRIIGASPNWIPAWETPESFDPLSSYPSEDQYGIFTGSGRVNVGLGRLTCRSLIEANLMVDKIIEYESARPTDPWIMKTTFVADDGLQAPGINDLFAHTDDAEYVAALVPQVFNKNKIYEYQYPTIYTSAGRRKPAVNDAIVQAINDGTLILNFNGHGNPRLWTHEAVFVRETDFSRLHNKGKYFFLTAATCNYSNFDALDDQSGGEELMAMNEAGAIGVFSATRAVFESQNAALNQTLYRNMFQYDAHGRVMPVRLGSVVFKTKQAHIDDNDRKYFLIGDPAMQLAYPELGMSVDSVNHAVPSTVIRLAALNTVAMEGRVLDTNGTTSSFNGNALVEVFDATKNVIIQDSFENFDGTFTTVTDSFKLAGDVLFRGQSSVASGRLSSSFVVPKDLSYAGGNGRVNLYCWNPQVDGAGSTANIIFGGTDSTAVADTQGPQMQIFLGSRSFRPGDVVGADPTLIVDLQDDHGVNTSGAGVGHRLEAWLDGAGVSLDLSSGYRSAVDDYRHGTITYPLAGITEGTHRLKIRAWDTYNNSSIAEVSFDVLSGAGLQIANLMNYPNPSPGPTIFTFEQNQPGSVEVVVKIYTVAGRLIQSLEPGVMTPADKYVRIPWDGRDREGSTIANGTYLYKVSVKSAGGRYSSDAYGKLTVLK